MPTDDSTKVDADSPTNAESLANAQQQTEERMHPTANAPSHYEKTQAPDFVFNPNAATIKLPFQLGTNLLTKKVGEGGAGIVYQAVSNIDNGIVAVKIIRPDVMASPTAVRRFVKESRLHAEIDSPYVTRHIEFNSFNGLYYIVSEFVDGVSLRELGSKFNKLPIGLSLLVIRDVLRALDALHSQGVVHRDVKPENVLAIFEPFDRENVSLDNYKQIKLTDFGLARHVEQSESLAMTQQKAILGTPLYMSPEQHSESRAVDARADVYSVGATLYHLLSGSPPFDADDYLSIAKLHREQQPKTLVSVDPEINEAISNVVAKALEKEPALRYQNAGEMLVDVERVLAGKPTTIRLYPATPASGQQGVRKYNFEWELDAAIVNLWPLVADTNRFNRAIGLPAAEFSHESTGGERRIVGQAKFSGMKIRWHEHPFQWIRDRSMSILREFESGPFEWFTSTVELGQLVDQRTRLTHCFQVKPRGLLGRMLTPFQFGFVTKRALDRVYLRLEKMANDESSKFACHAPFDKPLSMNRRQRERLAALTDTLARSTGVALAESFSRYLSTVSDPSAARIQPIPLANDLTCSTNQSLEMCMHAVSIGLLRMSWDIICPVCRIAASNVNTLEKIKSHSSCEFCNLEFEVNFSRSVELIFSVHPEIRDVNLGTFCIGGPFHSPHVIAQSRLLSGERVEIGTELDKGSYQIRGPQLNAKWEIAVDSNAVATRTDIDLAHPVKDIPTLQTGQICICLKNNSDAELLARLEQNADREDAVTAATVASHPMFQKLFPHESINPQDFVEKSNLNLLAIWDADSESTIREVGEIKMRSNWNTIQNVLTNDSAEGCEIVEASHDYVIVAFDSQSELATRLLNLYQEFAVHEEVKLRQFSFAIHRGELMIGNQPGQSRHFGQTLRDTKAAMERMKSQSATMLLHREQRREPSIQPIIQRLAKVKELTPLDENSRFLRADIEIS